MIHAEMEAVARGALAATRRVGRRLGQHVTPANIYSVIPAIPPLSDPVWSRRHELPVDTDAALRFMDEELAQFLPEVGAVLTDAAQHGFRLWNELYEGGDAELLYAMIRHARPRRVLELGSGFSTMITVAACERNAAEGSPADLLAVDPAPRTDIASSLKGRGRMELRDANELPLDRFEELEAGDILFIDTSHTVKLGSEVNRLVLEVLPRLAEGVWVHVHDIFLPYEYPRSRLIASGFFNEQYLLHAFLLGNGPWRIKLPVYAVWREHRDRLVAAIPSLSSPPRAEYFPSAFWLRLGRSEATC